MIKILTSLFVVIMISSIFLSTSSGVNAIITGVSQNGTTLTINFNPTMMYWAGQTLRYKGLNTNITPFCTQGETSPMICTLPTVPSCDSVRISGMSAIGIGTVTFGFSFNCTVV